MTGSPLLSRQSHFASFLHRRSRHARARSTSSNKGPRVGPVKTEKICQAGFSIRDRQGGGAPHRRMALPGPAPPRGAPRFPVGQAQDMNFLFHHTVSRGNWPLLFPSTLSDRQAPRTCSLDADMLQNGRVGGALPRHGRRATHMMHHIENRFQLRRGTLLTEMVTGIRGTRPHPDPSQGAITPPLPPHCVVDPPEEHSWRGPWR